MGAGKGKNRRAQSHGDDLAYDFPLYKGEQFRAGDVLLQHVVEERPVMTGFRQMDGGEGPHLAQRVRLPSVYEPSNDFHDAITLRLNTRNRHDPFGTLAPEERKWLGVRDHEEGAESERFYHLPSLKRALREVSSENGLRVASFFDISGDTLYAVRSSKPSEYVTIVHDKPGASWTRVLQEAEEKDSGETEILGALGDARSQRCAVASLIEEDTRSLLQMLDKMEENEEGFEELLKKRILFLTDSHPLRYEGKLDPVGF